MPDAILSLPKKPGFFDHPPQGKYESPRKCDTQPPPEADSTNNERVPEEIIDEYLAPCEHEEARESESPPLPGNTLISTFMFLKLVNKIFSEINRDEKKTLDASTKQWRAGSDGVSDAHSTGSQDVLFYGKLQMAPGLICVILIPVSRMIIENGALGPLQRPCDALLGLVSPGTSIVDFLPSQERVLRGLEFVQQNASKMAEPVISTFSQSSQMSIQGTVVTKQQLAEAARMQVQTEQDAQRTNSEQERTIQQIRRTLLDLVARLYEIIRQ